VFANADVRVRVWFNDGTNGSQLLAPDQRITSVGYAMVAATVPDGSISSSKLAPNLAITGSFSASGFSGSGSQLTNLNAGSTFIRWGNTNAPEGTELLYSGLGFMNYYSHSASFSPIVIKADDPVTGPAALQGGTMYPIVTQGSVLPPGIVANRLLRAAVCYVDKPTTIIWGTWTAPPGWAVVYKGYSMGGYYNHDGSAGPICVDADAFDSSLVPNQFGGPINTNATFVYPTQIATNVLGSGFSSTSYQLFSFIKCAVIKKNP
jgi:hypothetical protein